MTIFACILAAGSFAIFYYYDYCVVCRPQSSVLKWGFSAGSILTVAATLLTVLQNHAVRFGPASLLWGIGTALGLLFTVWALFFSLPKGTYADPAAPRRVYDRKLYALCRHPGFLGFFILYFCMGGLFGAGSWLCFGLLCGLNFLYIVLQDVWTFPHTFADYAEYRRRVPFLLPNAGSFRRCVHQCITRKDNGQ